MIRSSPVVSFNFILGLIRRCPPPCGIVFTILPIISHADLLVLWNLNLAYDPTSSCHSPSALSSIWSRLLHFVVTKAATSESASDWYTSLKSRAVGIGLRSIKSVIGCRYIMRENLIRLWYLRYAE